MASKRILDLLGLAFWLVLTFGVAAFASQFEPGEWYTYLAKPSWTPPGWLFGPVWGILYLSMSLSAWLIWRQRSRRAVGLPLGFYLIQLAANGLWSWLFFGRQWIGLALVDLVILVCVVAITAAMFLRVRKIAGIMMLPYLLWICFAAALNFQIWRLN
ncbi:MAG: tryptophan-rich sensory protein [candidate division Zixibacteria bacterium]|nr:tryptophan-rich sensory protein [candidate division Zixibacteria bacterium]